MALYERFLKKAPKQSRSRSVVESVRSAATELLGSNDEDEVTLQAVAQRAGVGIGSLYDYFVDRGSIFSGLSAKLTEDNLRRFEAQLAASRDEPFQIWVERMVDFLFETYLVHPHIPRFVLKVAHQINLMPALVTAHETAARTLAGDLRRRNIPDPELRAFTLVNMTMGVIHTLIWTDRDRRPASDAEIKRELSKAVLAYVTAP